MPNFIASSLAVKTTGGVVRQRSLAGYSPWGCKELDMSERLSMHAYSNNKVSGLMYFLLTLQSDQVFGDNLCLIMPASSFCHFMGLPSSRASMVDPLHSASHIAKRASEEEMAYTLPSFHLSEDNRITPCDHRGGWECSLLVRSGRGKEVGKHLGCFCHVPCRQLRGTVCSQFSIIYSASAPVLY